MFLRTSQSQQDNNDQAAYEDARRIVSNGKESRPSSINRFIQKLTLNLVNEEFRVMIEEKIVDREQEWNNYARWLEAINVLRTDDSNLWKKKFLAVKAKKDDILLLQQAVQEKDEKLQQKEAECSKLSEQLRDFLEKDKQELQKKIEAFQDIKRVGDHSQSMDIKRVRRHDSVIHLYGKGFGDHSQSMGRAATLLQMTNMIDRSTPENHTGSMYL